MPRKIRGLDQTNKQISFNIFKYTMTRAITYSWNCHPLVMAPLARDLVGGLGDEGRMLQRLDANQEPPGTTGTTVWKKSDGKWFRQSRKQCDIQCDIHLLTLLPTDLCVEKTTWIQPLGLPLHSHPQFFFRSWKNEVPLDPGREFGASISCNFDRTR